MGRLKVEAARPVAQRVFIGVLDGILRLAQPIMPFLAETIWQALAEAAPSRGLPTPEKAALSVCVAPWPAFPEGWRDQAMEARLSRMQELVRLVREMRNRYLSKDPRKTLDISVRCSSEVAADFRLLGAFVAQLGTVGVMDCGPNVTKPKQAATQIHADFELYVSLAGLIDVPAEVARLGKLKAEKEKSLTGKKGKLSNPSFVEGAKPEVVQKEREQVADLENQLRVIDETLRDLRDG
jgi:valyl-tRNA synthetase